MINHIEQLRQLISSDNWPLDINDWPCELNSKTNCLAFALGLPYADIHQSIFTLKYGFSEARNLLELFLKELDFDYREIHSIEEANSDEYLLQVFENTFKDLKYFHVIRRNLDGRWVHKKGWYCGPCEIDFWEGFYTLNPKSTLSATFAVRKRTS